MDWLEEAGWCHDPASNSIEQVEYGSPALGVISFLLFAVGIPIIFYAIPFNPSVYLFLLVYAFSLTLSVLFGRQMANEGTVKRITLSDLSYTVMKRNKQTQEHSKINILESTERFTHENLEVIVVEYEDLQGSGGEGGGGASYVTQYQVRLVEKRLVGDERYFTHLGKRFLKTDQSTLHADLRVEPRHLVHNHGNKQMKWNYGNDPAYDVQRMLVLKAKNKTQALELSERFREFFIDGGWKELGQPPSPVALTEASQKDKQPFWELN